MYSVKIITDNLIYFEIKFKVKALHHGLSTPLEDHRGIYVRITAILFQR